MKVNEATTTILLDADLSRAVKLVQTYLETNPSITNRSLREISGINYDQAIRVFRCMVDEGKLIKEGKSSGTKYSLPRKRK